MELIKVDGKLANGSSRQNKPHEQFMKGKRVIISIVCVKEGLKIPKRSDKCAISLFKDYFMSSINFIAAKPRVPAALEICSQIFNSTA